MLPGHLRPLFWDVDLDRFDPRAFPVYTIERVLEHGDQDAVQWLLTVFSADEIRDALRTNRRLSPRSATFWALVFEVPAVQVAALRNA
jgi:hypothetical protein